MILCAEQQKDCLMRGLLKLSILFAGLVLAACEPDASDSACTVTPIEETEALSTADIRRLAGPGFVDGSISTFSARGNRYWILPTVRFAKGTALVEHIFTKGPVHDIDAVKVGKWPEQELFGDAPGLKWITNTFEADDGVLAFVHSEYVLPGQYFGATVIGKDGKPRKLRGPGHSRISLAWYPKPDPENRAPKFQFLGHIIAPFDELRFDAWNVHGTPYAVHTIDDEAWFHVYFFDTPEQGLQGHLAVARAKVEDVLRAARNGEAARWQKYHQEGWTEGLGGRSRPLAEEHTIVHSDAAQSRNGRYFLANTFINDHKNSGKPSAIVLYGACDPVNLKEIARLRPISLPTKDANDRRNHGWQYLTIVDGDGTDNGTVGEELSFLVGYQYNKPERYVARMRYRVSEDCACESQ